MVLFEADRIADPYQAFGNNICNAYGAVCKTNMPVIFI